MSPQIGMNAPGLPASGAEQAGDALRLPRPDLDQNMTTWCEVVTAAGGDLPVGVEAVAAADERQMRIEVPYVRI